MRVRGRSVVGGIRVAAYRGAVLARRIIVRNPLHVHVRPQAPARLLAATLVAALALAVAAGRAAAEPEPGAGVAARATPADAPSVIVHNAVVARFVERFTHDDRDAVARSLTRAAVHLAMIRDVFEHYGVPAPLAFIPLVESGFDGRAVSRAGAAGLWQLMRATARLCGLRVDRWVDERFDPEKATIAAARHLRYLYERFGSWPLAEAAYNAGEQAVARAIRTTGSRDFWVLARSRWLTRETREFVPQVQAAAIVGLAAGRYGLLVDPAPESAVAVVTVPPRTALRALARAAGIEDGALRLLNPALVRGVTPPGGRYRLRVPADATARVTNVAARGPDRPRRPPARTRIARASARRG